MCKIFPLTFGKHYGSQVLNRGERQVRILLEFFWCETKLAFTPNQLFHSILHTHGTLVNWIPGGRSTPAAWEIEHSFGSFGWKI
jgi:hypothetical protein